jgi:hypothetical protein
MSETTSASVALLTVERDGFELYGSVGEDHRAVVNEDEASVVVLSRRTEDAGKAQGEKTPKGKKKRRRKNRPESIGSVQDSGYSEGSTSEFSPPSSTSSWRFFGASSTSSSEAANDEVDALLAPSSVTTSLDILHEETLSESKAATDVDTGDVFLTDSTTRSGVPISGTTKEAGESVLYECTISGNTEETCLVASSEQAFLRGLEVLQETTSTLSRACRCALPLQALMVLLLGVACLLPMAEEEFGCALSNNFQSSLTIMLKYTDGPPPT